MKDANQNKIEKQEAKKKKEIARIEQEVVKRKNEIARIKKEAAKREMDEAKKEYNNEKEVMNKELGKILENALENIPNDYKIVFTLRELNGFSVAETADALNISENNVKVRLNRAKAMLRIGITEMYTPTDIFEFNRVYCDEIVNCVLENILLKIGTKK